MSRISVPLSSSFGGGAVGEEINPFSGTTLFSDFFGPNSDWKTEQSGGFLAPTYSSQVGVNPNFAGVVTIQTGASVTGDNRARIADRLFADTATLKAGFAEMDFTARLRFDRGGTTGVVCRFGFFCNTSIAVNGTAIPSSGMWFHVNASGSVNAYSSEENTQESITLSGFDVSLWHTYGIYVPKARNFARFTVDGVPVLTVTNSAAIPSTSATVPLNVGVEMATLANTYTGATKTLAVDFMRYRYLHERIK